MITIRQIERLFLAQQFRRLHHELMSNRPEHAQSLEQSLAGVVATSALGMIRLDELSQAHHPFYRRMLNVVLTAQDKEGGWLDPVTTSLCLRALLCGNGDGGAIHGGLEYLAGLQKSDSIWPKEPIRRMPADPLVSAFVLYQLGEFAAFRDAVRFDDAINWFAEHRSEMDEDSRRLWSHARMRCGISSARTPTLWTSHRPAA